jgi:hypothetical protein
MWGAGCWCAQIAWNVSTTSSLRTAFLGPAVNVPLRGGADRPSFMSMLGRALVCLAIDRVPGIDLICGGKSVRIANRLVVRMTCELRGVLKRTQEADARGTVSLIDDDITGAWDVRP